jgi:hypothetical protein
MRAITLTNEETVAHLSVRSACLTASEYRRATVISTGRGFPAQSNLLGYFVSMAALRSAAQSIAGAAPLRLMNVVLHRWFEAKSSQTLNGAVTLRLGLFPLHQSVD